jgi:ATP-dependent exoDNAse (exonuclease V) alpha subunit
MLSKQSWFITGPGGSGKTTLIKDLQKKWRRIKIYFILSNQTSSVIRKGMTIHKFSARLKKSSNAKHLDLAYISMDEASMMQERLYKFSMMIKKIKPEIKFIISGDYNQLKPLNDRTSQ